MANTTLPISSSHTSQTTSSLPLPSTATLLLLLSTYLLLVRYLRYSRRDSMIKDFGYQTRESFASMTNTDAQSIISHLGELEFPRIFKMSLQFALFKTYGIPTISKLLVDTKQFSSASTASKRYADTGILIGEFFSHSPLHPRVLKAIARMNYLHSPYQKSGKISNRDLLYTLSVFITEPISWVDNYEWRKLNEMEICAIGTFWKGIGDAMGISYDELRDFNSTSESQEWKDGVEFYASIKSWAEEYERKFMVPNQYNKKTANELVPLLLFLVPNPLLPFARDAVGVLMGPLLRTAMSYPTPSPIHTYLTETLLQTRKFILRRLSLPRSIWLRVREISPSNDPGEDGRYYSTNYLVHPYYQKPGLWNRWGPMALITRVLGGYVPDKDRKEWWANGYKIEDVGPERKVGKGGKEMRGWEERLGRERIGGCPFAFGG